MTCWGTSSVTWQAGEEQGEGQRGRLADWARRSSPEALPGQPFAECLQVKHVEISAWSEKILECGL